MISSLGTPSLEHIMTDQAVFRHTYLHLILSDYLITADVENLNKTRKLFKQFHTMLLNTEPNITCKLFQHDLDCASQTTTPIKCKLKFFSLVVTNPNMPSIMRFLTGNLAASCRDPTKILRRCKGTLLLELLVQLKRGCNTTTQKFIGNVVPCQRSQSYSHDYHTSVSKTHNKSRCYPKQRRMYQVRSSDSMLARMF